MASKASLTRKTKSAQEKLQAKIAQTRNSKIVKSLEEKLPFEVKEEAFKEIVNNILVRAREIKQSLKKDPIATVKNYKSLLALNSLVVVKKKKTAKKTKKAASPKKALKKAKAAKVKKAIH